MDHPRQEWTRIRDDIGDLVFQLITDVTAAERAIFNGSPEAEALLDFVHTTGCFIAQLETAYNALRFPKTPDPESP